MSGSGYFRAFRKTSAHLSLAQKYAAPFLFHFVGFSLKLKLAKTYPEILISQSCGLVPDTFTATETVADLDMNWAVGK